MAGDSPVQRRKLLAKGLRRAGIGHAIISNPRHIFYFTGRSSNLNIYQAALKGQRSTSFALVGSEGECSVLVGRTDERSPWAQADREGPPVECAVSTYDDYDLEVTMVPYAPDVAREMRRWLRSSVLAKGQGAPKRVGIEEWHLPEIYRETLARVFPESRLVDISGAIMELREDKGKDELENIRRASKIIDYAYGFAKQTATAGKTELDIFSAINHASFEKFGVMALVWGELISGERTMEVAGAATKRKLKHGDTVVLDLQAAHDNYWCDTARTFVVGRPTEAQRRTLETIVEAKEMAARLLTPGTRTADIANAVNEFLSKRGHARMPHHLGHAVGLDDQERPWIIPGSREVVRENQAFVIEPGIYERGTGGMRVEDCYFITRSGRERVSRFPVEL